MKKANILLVAVLMLSMQMGAMAHIIPNQKTSAKKKTTQTVSKSKTKTKSTVNKMEKVPVGVEVFEVSSSTIPCENDASKNCLLVKKDNQKEYEIFNEDIDGFNFEPGNEYTLWVKKQLKTPPISASESIYKYVLVKIVSKNGIKLGEFNATYPNKDNEQKNDLDKGNMTTLIINEEQVPCENVAEKNCLLIKKQGDKTFEIFYQAIPGFSFERGYRQTILVQERKVEHPQVKQTLPIYTFVKVLKKEKIFDAVAQPATTAPEPTILLPTSSESSCPFDKKWYLKKMKPNDTTAYEVIDRSVWVDINYADKKIGGKAPCNSFMGGFTSDLKTTFVSDRLVSTQMYCDNMNLETMFLSLLQNADSYKQTPTTLDLYKGDLLLLSFER